MNTNSRAPIVHRKPTRYHESSPLRPARDQDNVGRQWQRTKSDAAQLASLSEAVKLLQQEVNRMRRYSSAEAFAAEGTFRGEYADQEYAEQEWVVRGSLGTFVAVQDVPAGIAPETGSPYWVALVWPAQGVWG